MNFNESEIEYTIHILKIEKYRIKVEINKKATENFFSHIDDIQELRERLVFVDGIINKLK